MAHRSSSFAHRCSSLLIVHGSRSWQFHGSRQLATFGSNFDLRGAALEPGPGPRPWKAGRDMTPRMNGDEQNRVLSECREMLAEDRLEALVRLYGKTTGTQPRDQARPVLITRSSLTSSEAQSLPPPSASPPLAKSALLLSPLGAWAAAGGQWRKTTPRGAKTPRGAQASGQVRGRSDAPSTVKYESCPLTKRDQSDHSLLETGSLLG